MANGDVDAINERLNGLVHLLQVVGIDGVNTDALVDEQRRMGMPSKNNHGSGYNAAPQSSDAQILEIIKKLQQAQADSPEILAALRSPELRALASLAAQKQGGHRPAEQPKRGPAPSLDDVMDDDDNYPKIGPGYSDDISVVSDMTTPTVMTKQQVADEEYYREIGGGSGALPPMHLAVGGPAQPARPSLGGPSFGGHGSNGHTAGRHGGKTKNMVGQVRPGAAHRAIAKSGGAAAQRRLNYQMAMTKLQSTQPGSGRNEGVPSSMDHMTPRKQKEVFDPVSPTLSQDPMEFPSMADGSGGKLSKKGLNKFSSSKKAKKTALAAQEDFGFDGTDQIRTPSTSATSGSTSSSGKKKVNGPSNDLDWGIGGSDGWPAFDAGNTNGNKKDIFVDNDGFFPNDAFTSNDGFGALSPSTPSKPRPKSPKRSGGSSSVNGARKSKSDGTLRKNSGRPIKKDGDSESSKRRDRDKMGKKKSRRASLTM